MPVLGRKTFAIANVAATNGGDVFASRREIHLAQHFRAVGSACAFAPTGHVGGAGIIGGQGVREWIVRGSISIEQAPQVPRAALGVSGGIEKLEWREEPNLFRGGPITGRWFANLHQTHFSAGSARIRIEPTFSPDDRLDERRVDVVLVGGGENHVILAAFPSLAPRHQEKKKT